MGQAASYAESSVQRALLRLKEEEQADEDELLCACGYSRATLASSTNGSAAAAALPLPGVEHRAPSSFPQARSADSHLPPPPASFGPLVSLTPEYYTLDELRDVLRYLPDPLWVSLYRVSLLYMLDNDRDGRINSTDISFFMDWGIKTVGRDVLPDQLAEVLQTYAALHCWHRCLQVGERIESESATAAGAAQPPCYHGGSTEDGGAWRTRRRPIASSSAVSGGSSSPPAHLQPHNQSVPSFMLLHFREALRNAPAGGPAPLAGTIGMTAVTSCDGAMPRMPSSSLYAWPRPAVRRPVTDSVRHAAAAHFAEWMLRLVQHQERDRRHERQRFERRVRSMTTTTDMKLGNAARLRHSSYVTHQSLRLRLSATLLSTEAASADASVDGDDVVVSVSRDSTPGHPPSMLSATPRGDAGAVVASPDMDDAALQLEVAALVPASPLTASLCFSDSPKRTSTARPPPSDGTPAALQGCAKTPPTLPSHSRSAAPPCAPIALGGGDIISKGTPAVASTLPAVDARTVPSAGGAPPDSRRRTAVDGPPAADVSPVHSSSGPHRSAMAPPARPLPSGGRSYSAHSSATALHEDLPVSASGAGASGEADENGSSFSIVNGRVSSSSAASAAGAGAGAAVLAPSSGSVAPLLAHQLSVLLMDAEAFYVELEASGWCTIGAVEEVYLDFAVEESYCVPFWSFCRLLNEASADEVQAALELPTDQAVVVLTSAVAVEEYRRAAALRQLQRQVAVHRDGGHSNRSQRHSSTRGGGWARSLQVIPMFVVSEYTLVAFVAAFIHAYWAMLESMGVDPMTQHAMAESTSALPTRSASTGA
ncbi:hypothetical protein LSCM1_05516 [Leishmania martiniquensis]|uniref:EF-hand domain-containing protein n=1 Tax=Leishmania martiniquensis TaxID=1580590 RepID=A0A836HRW5_9TRYP|nr:hypothetical protein LSCM1_05516 [Leishmania martiniquensis]